MFNFSFINWPTLFVGCGVMVAGVGLYLLMKRFVRNTATKAPIAPVDIPREEVVDGEVVEGTATTLALDGEAKQSKAKAKYPAIIVGLDDVWHFGKIPEPLGHIFIVDTSMPEHGDHYFVRTITAGKYEAFDPRKAKIISRHAPEDAYQAIHWEDVIPYVDDPSWMEKLPEIITGCVVVFTFLMMIIVLGK